MKLTAKFLKKLSAVCAALLVLFLVAVYVPHFMVGRYSSAVYLDPGQVPEARFGLLLGTSKYAYGRVNRFYVHRIEAAAALYKAGKISKILVSGDHSRNEYNEPQDIQDDLVAGGVDCDDIYLDYAGFSTLDSILRAKLVFKIDRFTIISQPFHCERALYIADRAGLEAVGFAAKDVQGPLATKVYLREYLARVKVVIDMELLDRQPRFLGENPYDFDS